MYGKKDEGHYVEMGQAILGGRTDSFDIGNDMRVRSPCSLHNASGSHSQTSSCSKVLELTIPEVKVMCGEHTAKKIPCRRREIEKIKKRDKRGCLA
jgi:hypothetical protein